MPWLIVFGAELRRVVLEDVAETDRVRNLAARLEGTLWQTTSKLKVIPYIGGTPCGTHREAEVVWLDQVLHVDDLSNAKLARLVPDRLGRYLVGLT